MKVKTSITLERELLKRIDRLPGKRPRSQVIEEALILYFRSGDARQRDATDLALLNEYYAPGSDADRELQDALSFQVPV